MILTQEQYDYLQSIKKKKLFGRDEIKQMYNLYNLLTNSNDITSTCGSCVAKRHRKLMEILHSSTVEQPKPKRGRPKKQDNGTDNTQ